MVVKKIFCKLRNKLFLNAIRASVAEIVKKEIDPLKKALSEIFAIQLNGGGGSSSQPYTPRLWFRKSETIILSSIVGTTAYCSAKIWRNQSICGTL